MFMASLKAVSWLFRFMKMLGRAVRAVGWKTLQGNGSPVAPRVIRHVFYFPNWDAR